MIYLDIIFIKAGIQALLVPFGGFSPVKVLEILFKFA
jgi:hypothetical protein